ncbi:hypothetical protein [Rhodoferax sp. BLA1]|uniref:hypothetical protein n=1 Tax=Rhodoferax sp. BLA1 TaxID=2576062 RepID=UPI0015D1538A|nr:hypothetical protein [Rhodoferax sp. BLA1]
MSQPNSASSGLFSPVSGTCPNGCESLNRDELALIGAAFVAGVGVGRGQLEGVAPGAALPEDDPKYCIHQIPSLPIKLNGKSAAPESVKDFDGKPLIYVIDDAAGAGDVLPVFSVPEKAMAYVADAPGKQKVKARGSFSLNTGSTPQQVADLVGGAVFLFEHINYGGSKWDFYAGTTGYPSHNPGQGNVADFRRVFCFLWWCQNINDRVSSIQNQSEVWAYVRPQRSFAVLHEHINFQGSQLWVPERRLIPNLVPFGWNDRASSLSYALI